MDLIATADQIRQFRERFRALDAMADTLDQIGNLDSAVRESQARLEKAKADEAEATTRLQTLLHSVQDQDAANAGHVAEAQAQAEKIIADAQSAAQAMTDEATTLATAAVQKGQQEAQAIVDKANQDAQAARNEAVVAAGATEAARATLETANAELAEVQGKLDAANAAVAKLLGK